MGYGIHYKNVEYDGTIFSLGYEGGFPACVTRSHLFIDKETIVESYHIESIGSKVLDYLQNTRFTQLLYQEPHHLIIFSNLDIFDFNEDLKFFNDHYAQRLNCPYVIGRFAHCTCTDRRKGTNKQIHIHENGTSFSVALFNKMTDEVVDFALSFLHQTKRHYATILIPESEHCYMTIKNIELVKSYFSGK